MAMIRINRWTSLAMDRHIAGIKMKGIKITKKEWLEKAIMNQMKKEKPWKGLPK